MASEHRHEADVPVETRNVVRRKSIIVKAIQQNQPAVDDIAYEST